MKRKYLVTGVAGSGKTSLCRALEQMSYEAYDIEDIEGMFAMYRKDTGELYVDYENGDPEKIKNSEWRCHVEKLQDLLSRQKSERAFYCGVASNMDDLFPLFDKVIVLSVKSEALHARLLSREGTEDMGNTEESRQMVLGWKAWWEEEMENKGAIVVKAEGSPVEVVQRVVRAL